MRAAATAATAVATTAAATLTAVATAAAAATMPALLIIVGEMVVLLSVITRTTLQVFSGAMVVMGPVAGIQVQKSTVNRLRKTRSRLRNPGPALLLPPVPLLPRGLVWRSG